MSKPDQGVLVYSSPVESLRYRLLVIKLYRDHLGRHNAVTLQELADHVQVGRRAMHDMIRRLVDVKRLPVGTTSGGENQPPGVFIIVDEADRQTGCKHLLVRALKILKRYHILSTESAHKIAGQIELELER